MLASSGRKGQPNGGDDEQGNPRERERERERERGEECEKTRDVGLFFFFFSSVGNLWRLNNGGVAMEEEIERET